MSVLEELQHWVRSKLFPGRAEESRRPDGGTSCYRPIRRREEGEAEQAREKAAEYAAGGQQIPYVHTGFTDMTPPAGGSYVPPAVSGDPYGYGAAQAAQQELRTGYAAGRGAQPQSNISYMPGSYAPDAGSSYTHVEHIMAVTSLRSCYEAIECMKNGETLIITMDTIINDSESIRCQDMLAGGAFTLGCSVRMLQGGQVLLIAPAGVKVLPEQAGRAWTDPMAMGGYAQQPREAEPPRRERRVSQNAVGWGNAFQEENRGYNPYTGGMPAAAGEYGNYGGYGY